MRELPKARLEATYHNGEMLSYNVQYNPTEFTLDKSIQYAEIPIPGLDAPLLQFVRGQSEKLSVELFFDSTDKGMGAEATSVTKLTDPVYQLMKIDPDGHAPPICSFLWNENFPGHHFGDEVGNQKRNGFQCIVESIKQKFTLFSPRGVPLRATLTLTLREYKPLDQQLSELGLSSPNRTHSHIVQEGETLSGIAASYYRRPGDWRYLADRNQIEDPRRMSPGALLAIPSIR